MQSKKILLFSFFFLLLFFGCEKESIRIDDFFVEFAIVKKNESNFAFLLDNGKVLTLKSPTNLDLEDGKRVILNYTPLEDGFIKVNSARRVFMDSIKIDGYPENIKTDPVKIISVWVSGNYLNMSLESDYHSKAHQAALFRDMNVNEQTLYFSYSREDDPAGAPTLTYLSFNLESLQKKNFTVYINTYKGKRKLQFQLLGVKS